MLKLNENVFPPYGDSLKSTAQTILNENKFTSIVSNTEHDVIEKAPLQNSSFIKKVLKKYLPLDQALSEL